MGYPIDDDHHCSLVVVVFLGVFWFLLLPWLWEPKTQADENQNECPPRSSQKLEADENQNRRQPRGSELSKDSITIDSGVVRTIRLTDEGEFVNRCALTDAVYETEIAQSRSSSSGTSTVGNTTQTKTIAVSKILKLSSRT